MKVTFLNAEVRTFGPHTVEVRTPGGLYSAIDTNLDDALRVLGDRIAKRHPDAVLRPRLIKARPYGGWYREAASR